jgi:putative ABC transport system permease protein
LDQLSAVMAGLESAWDELAPDQPFVAQFMDERLSLLYAEDRRWQSIIAYASALALLISCLGLFGVAALSAAQRRKEIGVRKVLGASVGGIVLLLSRDFAQLVAIGFVIAVPISWYIMSRWLDAFAYRISMSAVPFILAGLAALVIALLTVSRQSISAAVSEPVHSLRTD